ncbi:MAG: hypothetical protein U0Y08_05985 [Bacteroidia bacterium]
MYSHCQPSAQTNNTMPPIDINKRNELVQRYDLLHFAEKKEPVLLTLDEFFDGNNDEASIAPNRSLSRPLSGVEGSGDEGADCTIGEYYRTLKALAEDPRNVAAFAEIKDINIYPGGNLHDNEWFYTDVIYFIGDLSPEEIVAATAHLMPDEVDYCTDPRLKKLQDRYPGHKIVYVWWD